MFINRVDNPFQCYKSNANIDRSLEFAKLIKGKSSVEKIRVEKVV